MNKRNMDNMDMAYPHASAAELLRHTAAFTAPDPWSAPRRGSWVRHGARSLSDLVLVEGAGAQVSLVADVDAPSNVQQALRFLAGDITRLTGVTPELRADRPAEGPWIEVHAARDDLRPEAYAIVIRQDHVEIAGSDARGAAFGLYELSERMGIDPLYHWTGFTPPRTLPLVLRSVEAIAWGRNYVLAFW
jgi:hypothetical protein